MSDASPESRAEPKPSTLSGRKGMFQALAIRDFRLLWVSSIAASFAMQMQMVARGWLIYDMTESPMALTWVMLSFMLPSLIFSLAGGVIADRLQKKFIMLGSQSLNTGATILLAYIVYSGEVTFSHFIYFGLFNGTILSFSMPARTSVIPEIVGREYVVNAMALQSATFNLSRILGPTLAGIFIAIFAGGNTSSTTGVGIVFYVIAVLYAVSVLMTWLLDYEGKPQRNSTNSMLEDVAEGFQYMREERVILGLLIIGFIPMTFGFAATSLLPVFNKEVLSGGPDSLGYLLTAMGGGALFGSLILAKLGDMRHKGRILFYAAYIWAIALLAFALSNTLWAALFFGVFTGLCGSLMGSLNMSVVQLAIRPEIRGRVMAIMMMLHGLMPFGIIPISWLAEVINIQVALSVSAVLLAATTAATGYYFPELLKIDKGHQEEDISQSKPRGLESETTKTQHE